MNYKEYEEKANQTPIYNPKVAIPYVTIGLAGELGELFEKIEKDSSIEDIVGELGDVFWYLAMIRVELQLPLEENWDWNKSEDSKELLQNPFGLISEVGKISEQVKKYLRDDWKEGNEIVYPESRKEKTLKAWKTVWSYLGDVIERLGITIDYVAQKNNEKLSSRKERNVLHGSGDNR